ncbi:MAG: carboxymuconolactone decarboxylase family protein [Deltaproteobacteria bacterium]|nr:carboxymuconolactone decarboxylase family protein [Deltaproteobacteria bacterium]MBN2687948.1 carboxymuconolactone decarboxylase family protein [Deltaproteobacteria bacterium]
MRTELYHKEGIQLGDEAIRKRTQETATKLFGKGIKMDPPYLMWREFDRDLANEFSKFITGNLYSRTVLTLPERQMVACAMLAATRATGELKLHVNAALNVGCDPRKLAEIFFQVATYAGMPAVNEALEVYRDVLKERGEWPIK